MEHTKSEHLRRSSNVNRKSSRSSKSEVVSKKSSVSKQSLHKSKHESQVDIKGNLEEEKDLVVAAIKQTILDAAFVKIYEKYLEKQAVYFVSHCSQLAWKALVKWNYQRKDSYGYRELDKDILDVEPETSKKDSWAGHSILCNNGERLTVTKLLKEKNKKSFEEEGVFSPIKDSNTSKERRSSCVEEERKVTITKARKIIQEMKSMNKKYEDISPEPSKDRHTKSIPLKIDSYELPLPVALQPKLFPSSTVKVKYEVSPGTREFMSTKKVTTKTIHLHRPITNNVNAEDNIPRLQI